MGLIKRIFGERVPDRQPVHLTSANFNEEVLQSDVPVVIDFWGPGCGPCKQLEAVIMKLAGKYEGRVKVCEFNVREAPHVALRLGIQGTPTVVYYKPKGVLHDRVSGFRGRIFHEQVIDHELLGLDPGAQA